MVNANGDITPWKKTLPTFNKIFIYLSTSKSLAENVGSYKNKAIIINPIMTTWVVKKYEGMNPHTPKWTPILGVGVPMDSRIFRAQLQGLKPIALERCLYHWKAIEA